MNLPLGDASFADVVVSFKVGSPKAANSRWSDPALALGGPDYVNEESDRSRPSSVTLGCGGELVLQFIDNALVDVSGPDLYVFEVGPSVEATVISISTDGVEWFEVGRAAGGTAAVDIARLGKQNEQYRYVRLTDARADCGGEWPGADIDAVGAIGSAFRVSFDEKVLFDVGKSELRHAARGALIEAAGKLAAIKDTRIQIEGHTDNTGGAEMNQRLSEERAESVRAFLSDQPALAGRTIIAKGFGMSRPTSTNATAPGRQKNRRVDIIAAPTR